MKMKGNQFEEIAQTYKEERKRETKIYIKKCKR